MAWLHIAAWLLSLLAGATWLAVSYSLVAVLYNLLFHPLAKYPGPFWARISSLYASYHFYRGDLHHNIDRCHEKYGWSLLTDNLVFKHFLRLMPIVGPVVRYFPDRLVFSRAEALRGTGPSSSVFFFRDLQITQISTVMGKTHKN